MKKYCSPSIELIILPELSLCDQSSVSATIEDFTKNDTDWNW